MKKVALEEDLSHLENPLRENGFEPVEIDSNEQVSAIIISGRDENMTNVQNVEAPVPVIDARGLDGEDIIRELKSKLI
ncbi:YkuS family protein [Natranaerofaba carboxydovora]|uniref:YkuS family protein n=1 Tax=Natranaerofaba carboxydovora TaxID=2742683 RepID=UPI001F13E646|nr:YkuS family protein [Natranaerofaba carboxydovora]UMZ74141.1 hypothetical protein ACONDI_01721 [Natranaerofaba carboxydovora]